MPDIPRYRVPRMQNLDEGFAGDPGRIQLEAARDTIKNLIKNGEYPAILSGHLWGSLVKCDSSRKTYSHSKSDIDMTVFIDQDLKDDNVDYDDLIKSGIQKKLKARGLKIRKYDKYTNNIFITYISKNIIDLYLNNSERVLVEYLAPMFYLSIGKGVNQYRTYLLKRLKEKGDRGEEVWRKIVHIIASRDNIGRNPSEFAQVRYPVTLDKAIETYHKQ